MNHRNNKRMYIRPSRLKIGNNVQSPRISGYLPYRSEKCQKIIIGDRAYSSIISEALAKDPYETGGILLGHYSRGIWYVVEATDSGVHSVHTTSYHEMDEQYHNHIYPVLSRLYAKDPGLLGLWHRHPGNYNTFSTTDDKTNNEYAKAVGNGTLSFLLNFTPEPKLTCYYMDSNVYYKPDLEIGDQYFDGTAFLQIASIETLCKRKAQIQREINYYKEYGYDKQAQNI